MLHYILVGIIVLAAIILFIGLLRNFRTQRDFESSGRTPPEQYD